MQRNRGHEQAPACTKCSPSLAGRFLATSGAFSETKRFVAEMASPLDTLKSYAWRRLVAEALRVLIAGVCLGAAVAIIGGVPDLAVLRADDPSTCSAPIAARPGVRWIEQEEAQDMIADPGVSFADARSRGAYEAGHVAGAIHLPMDTGVLDAHATRLVEGARVVITYCDTTGECASSRRLAGLLSEAGLVDVRVLRGGMPAWLEHGYPAEAGPCRVCP